MKNSRIRSATKSFTWRITGIVILLLVGWLITGDFGQATVISFTFHFVRVILYYVHERGWELTSWGKGKHGALWPFYVSLVALILSFIFLIMLMVG